MHANLPVGRYVQRKITESGMKKVEIVRLCGWKNVNKGLRRIDSLIQNSVPDEKLLKKLLAIIKLDKDELNRQKRLTNTIWEMESAKYEKERIAGWQPFLYALAERTRPAQARTAALCGGEREKYAEVPVAVAKMSFEKQLYEVGRILQAHYAQKTGRTMFFGAIVGYLYQYTCDYGVEFSIDGEVIGEKKMTISPPQSEAMLVAKTVAGKFSI